HRVQSMHSSGSITRKFGPSWKQSTGQTSTQSVYLHLMQFSVTTKGMAGFRWRGRKFKTATRWLLRNVRIHVPRPVSVATAPPTKSPRLGHGLRSVIPSPSSQVGGKGRGDDRR